MTVTDEMVEAALRAHYPGTFAAIRDDNVFRRDMREALEAAIEVGQQQNRQRKREREQMVREVQDQLGCTAREARLWLADNRPEYGWRQR